MARTNVVLEDALVERAMKLTGARTKREVIHVALERLVDAVEAERSLQRRYERACKGLLELEGVGWQEDLAGSRKDRAIEIRPARSRR